MLVPVLSRRCRRWGHLQGLGQRPDMLARQQAGAALCAGAQAVLARMAAPQAMHPRLWVAQVLELGLGPQL